MRRSAYLIPIAACILVGSFYAGAQQQKLYIQLSPTPNHLANQGAGFLQVDVNGQPFIGQVTPGTGTVLNSQALANNSMVVGVGGANIQTIGGSIGGPITTAGPITTTGATGGATLDFGVGNPTYIYPTSSNTLASLNGTETLASKTLTSPVINNANLNGTVGGNPSFTGAVKLLGVGPGNQIACLGLDANNTIVTLSSPCGTGGSVAVGSEFTLVPEVGQTVGSVFTLVPE